VKTIKIETTDLGKNEFSMAALARPAVAGEVVTLGDLKVVIGRQLTTREVIEQSPKFYDCIVRKVPAGAVIYWYETHQVVNEDGSKRSVDGSTDNSPEPSEGHRQRKSSGRKRGGDPR